VAGWEPPTANLRNNRLVGLNVPPGATPGPDRVAVGGRPTALSAALTLALMAPAVVGANCTPKKHELPAARLLAPNEHAGAPLLRAEERRVGKEAPARGMEVMFSVALLLLVDGTLVGGLVRRTSTLQA